MLIQFFYPYKEHQSFNLFIMVDFKSVYVNNYTQLKEVSFYIVLCSFLLSCNTSFLSDMDYEMIPSLRGGTLLVLNGYTYSYKLKNRRYQCSKLSSMKCRSFVKLDTQGKIMKLSEVHNHPPLKYKVSPGMRRPTQWQ